MIGPAKRSKYLCTLILMVALATSAIAQRVQRGEMEDILNIVSADVQKNYYDPQMKGLDWPSVTEEARQHIRNSNNAGQMILAIVALLDKLGDSHTYFIPPRLTQRSEFGFSAQPFGPDIRVYEVADRGPAAKAGLEVGATIISLNGVQVDRTSFSEVFRLLQRVVPAAALDVGIRSSDHNARIVHIPAQMILTQEHQYLDDVFRAADRQRAMDVRVQFSHKDYGDGITYVAIPSFDGTPSATYSAVKAAEHSRSLVLDFRGNSGGRSETVLSFLGFFDGQPHVLAKRMTRNGSEDWTVKPQYSGFKQSIAVLVDSNSASGAELAARYLQLNYKAHVLGDRTSGKVNDGQFFPGKIGARFIMPFGVMVTTAKLVMADGTELEGHGVIPDSMCIPNADELRQHRDPCLEQALTWAKKSLADSPPAN